MTFPNFLLQNQRQHKMEQLTGSKKTSLEKVEAYRTTFLDYHKRYHRSLVVVHNRQICGDPEVADSWGAVETNMNRLLEELFTSNTNQGFSESVAGVEIALPSPDEQPTVAFEPIESD